MSVNEMKRSESVVDRVNSLLSKERWEIVKLIEEILKNPSREQYEVSLTPFKTIVKKARLLEIPFSIDIVQWLLEELLPVYSEEIDIDAYDSEGMLKPLYEIPVWADEKLKETILKSIPKKLNYKLFRGLWLIWLNDTPKREVLIRERDEFIKSILSEKFV